jgi:hypothetical protein
LETWEIDDATGEIEYLATPTPVPTNTPVPNLSLQSAYDYLDSYLSNEPPGWRCLRFRHEIIVNYEEGNWIVLSDSRDCVDKSWTIDDLTGKVEQR